MTPKKKPAAAKELAPTKKKARPEKAIAAKPEKPDVNYGEIERILVKGDLGAMTPEERENWVLAFHKATGLPPWVRGLQFIINDRKEIIPYIRKEATDYWRHSNNVDIKPLDKGVLLLNGQATDVYYETVQASLPNGRVDVATGAVSIRNLSGPDLANAVMKAGTKAKRRATLSILGIGMTDESELDTIPIKYPEVMEGPRRVEAPRGLDAGQVPVQPAEFIAPELLTQPAAMTQATMMPVPQIRRVMPPAVPGNPTVPAPPMVPPQIPKSGQ